MSATKDFFRSLRVVLTPPTCIRLGAYLLAWAFIAYIAWGVSFLTDSYAAGFKAGLVFTLVIFGVIDTAMVIRRIIRQAVHL